jgi:hypothetical protein
MPTKVRFAGVNHTQLPQIVSDGIALKGLPQTAGYPDGYGDLAEAVVYAVDSSAGVFTPEMFGAIPDGVADCSQAIKDAVSAAMSTGFSQDGDPSGKVVFSAGVYRITESGVFSQTSDFKRAGITFVGAGPLNTIIWLDPASIAVDAWFYDNGATVRSWNCTFRDMAFHGGATWRTLTLGFANHSNKIKGFKFTGPDWESAHVFDNCAFAWLDTLMEVAGANNVDTIRFSNCTVNKCKDINFINNPQSMNISWSQCYLSNIFGDFARWGAGVNGGGDLHFTGGTMVFTPDSFGGGTSYIFNMQSGGPVAGNASVNFNGRFEIRGAGALIGVQSAGSPVVSFDACTFLSTATAPRKVLSVSDYSDVTFNNCSFANGTGQLEFEILGSTRRAKQGRIQFFSSYLAGFSSLFVLSIPSNKGYFKVDGCWETQADYSTEPHVRQINGTYTGTDLSSNTGSRPSDTYVVNPLRSGALPLTTGSDSTVQLPAGATIFKIHVVLPAAAPSSTGSLYRLFVGSNDKSVVYAQTTGAAQNLGFTLAVDVAVRMGSTVADRTVRLWADNGSGGTSGAGSCQPTICLIHYY